jgi:hypothetical protein
MNRKEYLDQAGTDNAYVAHRQYYAQFVTDPVKQLVLRDVGRLVLTLSKDDPYLNDIPLKRWDTLVPMLPATVRAKLKECGDYLTLGVGVCILKEAARQLLEADGFSV